MKPMFARSFIRVVIATAHPCPTGPRIRSTGMTTSSMKISLNSESPVIWRIGRTSTPGACMSMRKYVRPSCLFSDASVRARRMHQSAMWANDDQTFCPLTRYPPSPSGMAFVWSEARSEPLPGSLKPWHQTSSPVRIFSRKRSFCSSVPWARIVGAAIPRPMTPTCSGASAMPISSSRTAWSDIGASWPP